MKILKKLAPVFRGLVAVVAGLLALVVVAIPFTQIPEVRTTIDDVLGVPPGRVREKKRSSDVDVKEYVLLCTDEYSDSSIKPLAVEPLLEIKPSDPSLAAPVYETFRPAWEYALDGLVIGLGVVTGLVGAAWLAMEFVPVAVEMFGKGKEEE